MSRKSGLTGHDGNTARAATHGSNDTGTNGKAAGRTLVGRLAWVGVLLGLSTALLADDDPSRPERAPAGDEVFAVVGEESIGWERVAAMSRVLARQRFFHGGVPLEKIEAFNREVEQTVIDRALLLQESGRRGYKPRRKEIERRMAMVDARNQQSPGWRAHREALLGQLQSDLEENDLLEQLETAVKDLTPPDEADIRRYYDNQQERFVTPARARVSLILLPVEPWAKSEEWQKQVDSAQRLVAQLRDGADFAALARNHSRHESAASGGDLGVVHQGMLAAEAQQALDRLNPGEVADPVRLLQGIAILKLAEKIPPMLNEYASVRARAEELLRREREESTWNSFLQHLRDTTSITVYRKAALPRREQPQGSP